jgi:hypothetical protein
VLDHLEDAPWLTDTLGALGAKHVGYGVTRGARPGCRVLRHPPRIALHM